jgi:hypothetical protein
VSTRALERPVRLLLAFAAALAVVLPAVPALGQGTTTGTTAQMSIDSPAANATVTNGTQIDIGGWAADTAGPGTGVDIVRVYLDNRMEAGSTPLGDANLGFARPDVAAALGSSAVTNSGFNLLWTPSNVSAGQHTLYVYAHSIANNWVFKTVTINVQATPTPTPRRPIGGSPYDSGYYPGGGPYDSGYYAGPYPPGPGPMYPPPPGMYPPYPSYPGYPYPPGGSNGGRVCIMIYPPPPGCQ